MTEQLKVKAWLDDRPVRGVPHASVRIAKDGSKSWREIPLYAIPSTHRVVSVELLEKIAGMLSKTMYHEGPPTAKKIRAIIDNKGE